MAVYIGPLSKITRDIMIEKLLALFKRKIGDKVLLLSFL